MRSQAQPTDSGASEQHTSYVSKHISFSQKNIDIIEHSFTTEPKDIKKLSWHKQTTVKTRCHALQESFYPDNDISYEAVRMRMASLLGIVDRKSVLAYLGRLEGYVNSRVEQTVQYESGTTVRKHHSFRKKLPEVKGYIDIFNIGYIFAVPCDLKNPTKECWFIHWNYEIQTALLPKSEGLEQKVSIENISLPNNGTLDNQCELCSEIEKRESESKRERNSESESIPELSEVSHRRV